MQISLTSFRTHDGVAPPQPVLGVYKYFAVIGLLMVLFGLLFVLAGLSFIIIPAGYIFISQKVNLNELLRQFLTDQEALNTFRGLIQIGFLEMALTLPVLLICAGIKRRTRLVYYFLYTISASQPKVWHDIPWTSYIKNVLSPEFKTWFFSQGYS
jgi:hypothetical protein